VRISSRRGSVVAPVHIDKALRPGLTFMTFHFPDDVATNMLTSDRVDPLVGTAEFKATAVRIETDGIPDSRRDVLSHRDHVESSRP
jgi:anaerobic selenocysteine-containing dehydrogenase